MSKDDPRNSAASVHARLLKRGREQKRDFNLLLIQYALERFLARLSHSSYKEQFVLKGALLFVAWEGAIERPTRDLDLLKYGDPDIAGLERVFREVCAVDVESDGMIFDPSTVRGSEIREGAMYDGVRMKFMAFLGNGRVPIQVDVGFGDAVQPSPKAIEFPVLLDHTPPKVLAYPAEAVVAEKFHAMITLGMANSRLKDYYDIWRILETMPFKMPLIASALTATFKKRGTELPVDEPEALTNEYALRWAQDWRRVCERFELANDYPPLMTVIEKISAFLAPVLESIASKRNQVERWVPGKGWYRTRKGN